MAPLALLTLLESNQPQQRMRCRGLGSSGIAETAQWAVGSETGDGAARPVRFRPGLTWRLHGKHASTLRDLRRRPAPPGAGGPVKAWLYHRLWLPLLALLRAGLSPEGLAWSVALGLALGVSPLFGTSTALCAGASLAFRLNQPAMQLANYLAYPLQIALLLPFIRLGERLFGAPHLPLDLPVLLQAIRTDAWAAAGLFWTSLWHAGIAWLLVAPVPAAMLAWGLTRFFRLASRSMRLET